MSDQNFRTVLKTTEQKNKIDHASNILLFGSCFSENIGQKLAYFKFKEHTNPYGILFNPIAIETTIRECIQKKIYTKNDLFFHNERWHSFQHHSDFSDENPDTILKNINASILEANENLKKASHIIITLGTAWVYEQKSNGIVVANCHKVPQKQFSKKIIPVTGIVQSLQNIQKIISETNPSSTIIFTVSPVRHLKDGMIENSQSKAHLLAAIHETIQQQNSFYFPSYEIMLDDLRDYRFFKRDMLHPNEIAIDYIWEAFKKTWIHSSTEEILKTINTIQKGLTHRPFNPNSEAHQKFLIQLQLKMDTLQKKYKIDFT